MKVVGRNLILSGKAVKLAQLDGDNFRFVDNPDAVVGELHRCRERIDIFTFIQGLNEQKAKYQYPMDWDNLAVIELTSFDNWWKEQLGFKARNKAKQAEKKGVTLCEMPFDEVMARGIWEIYNETPIRQGRRFRHYGKTIEAVTQEASTFLDCSLFIGAVYEGKLIGFAKLTIDQSGTQAGLMHIISMLRHRDKAPTNALIARAVRACADRGIRYLVYANFAYGNKSRDSLSDFKERSGFCRVEVPRYYIPLTPLGQMVLRLGLHRSMHYYLPETFIAKFRDYRAAWYDWRYGALATTAEAKAITNS